MNYKHYLLLLLTLFLFNCTTKTDDSSKEMISTEVVQEIQQLDSLNQKIETKIKEIEGGIEAVEAALLDLDL